MRKRSIAPAPIIRKQPQRPKHKYLVKAKVKKHPFTPGYVIPANDDKAPYPTTLEELQASCPPWEDDSAKITARRNAQRTTTDWGCTYSSSISEKIPLNPEEYMLVVDDFANANVQLPDNHRATNICELRDGTRGYPVKGDAFLYKVTLPNTLNEEFIELMVELGDELRTKRGQ